MNIAVVGAGVFGLAASIELRARGHRVTVFEQGVIPNPKATSTDVSKAIRRTWYADHRSYVELAEQAGQGWRAWERRFGERIYHQTGMLNIFRAFTPGSPMYENWKYLTGRGAKIERLTPGEAGARFPQFVYQDNDVCVYDSWAGYIESGRAVGLIARMAAEDGVILRENSPARRVHGSPGTATVVLDSGPLAFDRVVVATGAWTGKLLPAIGASIKPVLHQMVLIKPADPSIFAHGRFPVWADDLDNAGWYGFPLLREGWVKVAMENVGRVVDPDVERIGTREFIGMAMEFIRRRIPEMAKGEVVEARACLYENTPDDHFIIDWLPGAEGVLVAAGGSGHGFKFGASIGPVIADALENKPNPLGDLFRIKDRLQAHAEPARTNFTTRGFAIPSGGHP